MKLETHQNLWEKILHFAIDDPNATFKFSNKLAAQQGWTLNFASDAIHEYKKFIFLCCISPSGASPSKIVDEVWHLHLTYTENYWKDFCGKTLEKEIHHHPSKGGVYEKDKHRDWYAETLKLYKEIFGESPPEAIWPRIQNSAKQTLFANVPTLNYFAAYKNYFYLLIPAIIYPFFFNKLHPFQLTGPQFLSFYLILLLCIILFFLMAKRRKQKMILDTISNNPHHSGNIYAVARFIFSKGKAIETAIVDLVSKEILHAKYANRFRFDPLKTDADTLRSNPLAANLLQHHSSDSLISMERVMECYNEDLTYDPSLARLCTEFNKKDRTPFIIAGGFVLLGLVRINQGLSNGYPVTYLQLMWLACGFILVGFALTFSAKKMLRYSFIKNYKDQALAYPLQQAILPKFLFLGLAALAGTYVFANLESTFRHYSADYNGNDSSGTTSSCSSGCGSSCGGGCGGCGGGD